MPRTSPAFLLLLALTVACSSDTAMAPLTPSGDGQRDVVSSGNSSLRPAGGQCTGDVVALPPVSGDPANLARIRIDFACNFLHMGRTTATVEHLVFFTGPATAITSHSATYRAANGDELHATWSGTAELRGPTILVSGNETYAGGTGRFTNASGSASVTGTVSLITSQGELTFAGASSY